MIARVWRGVTREADQHKYFEYLKQTGLKDYAHMPGNRGMWTLRRVHDGKAEFTVISLWDSYESIRAFAGPEFEKAMYYPEDEKYLVAVDLFVTHHEVLTTPVEWRTAALVVAVWTVHALLMACQIYIFQPRMSSSISWGSALAHALEYSYIWLLLTPLILAAAKRFPLSSRTWLRNSLVHVGAAAALATIATAGTAMLAGSTAVQFFFQLSAITRDRAALGSLGHGFTLYWVVLLISQAFVFMHRYNLERLKRWELQAELVNAELQALKMQLRPHFLFNVLHSISELIHRDPRAADRTIVQLSELLRISLNADRGQEVTLREELELLDRYIDIQKIRFGENLSTHVNASPDTLDALVPTLVLQPLVENAMRHGVADRTEGGRIEIMCQAHSGRLLISVADNGKGLPDGGVVHLKEGTGLRSTRSRLERLYGRDHRFRLENRPAEGAEAIIEIPYRVDADKRKNETDTSHRS